MVTDKLVGHSSGSDRGAIVLAERTKPLKRTGLRFGTWGINVNFENGTLEVYRANRPELAHLTILTRTKSGELDIHLTYGHEAAMSGLGVKNHEPLVRFTPEELGAVGSRANDIAERVMKDHLLTRYRRFRPGWLFRNGYLVMVVSREAVHEWLKKVVPHKKRKFRLDPETAFSEAHLPAEFSEAIYEPGILHVLRAEGVRAGVMDDAEVNVHAVRPRGGRGRQDDIILSFTTGPDGTAGWWGIPNGESQRLHRTLLAKFFDWAVPRVRAEHAEKFERVVVGLGLAEDDDGQRSVENVRAFLRNPRNPIRQPYPSTRRK